MANDSHNNKSEAPHFDSRKFEKHIKVNEKKWSRAPPLVDCDRFLFIYLFVFVVGLAWLVELYTMLSREWISTLVCILPRVRMRICIYILLSKQTINRYIKRRDFVASKLYDITSRRCVAVLKCIIPGGELMRRRKKTISEANLFGNSKKLRPRNQSIIIHQYKQKKLISSTGKTRGLTNVSRTFPHFAKSSGYNDKLWKNDNFYR